MAGAPYSTFSVQRHMAFLVGKNPVAVNSPPGGKPRLYWTETDAIDHGLRVNAADGHDDFQTLSATWIGGVTVIGLADVPHFASFLYGRYNSDDRPDLIAVKTRETGTGKVEVHVLTGAGDHSSPGSGDFPQFQHFLLQIGTPIGMADGANFRFATADFNGDGRTDLYCLKVSNTGTGKLEVHVLGAASGYQDFLLQTPTPITSADAGNFRFALGDFNGDGHPDLYCLKVSNTGSGQLEVHILSGSANYGQFLLQTPTPIAAADASANFALSVADHDGSGVPDLYAVKLRNAATHGNEIHILRGKPPATPPPPPTPIAELTFLNTWAEPTEFPTQGEVVTIFFSFANVGTKETGAFTVRLVLDGVESYDVSAPTYAPGSGDTAYLKISGTLAAGSHRVDAYLDVTGAVAEGNKANNYSTHAFSVIGSGAAGPPVEGEAGIGHP